MVFRSVAAISGPCIAELVSVVFVLLMLMLLLLLLLPVVLESSGGTIALRNGDLSLEESMVAVLLSLAWLMVLMAGMGPAVSD